MPPLRLRWLIFILGIFALTTLTLMWASPGLALFQSPRTGFDPLAPDEMAQAQTLALKAPDVARRYSQTARSEVLLIERHIEEKAVTLSNTWPRRADVYIYLYDTDTLVQALVNLTTQKVDAVTTAQNVQLPLTANETAAALQLALADPTVRAEMEAQYQAITGQALTDPKQQLTVQALAFSADSMPALTSASACGHHRCAQLMLATTTNVLIDILPILDLSQQRLVYTGPFFTEEQ